METSPVFEELRKWIGKPAEVRVKCGKKILEYEGTIRGIDLSRHNDIGNICLGGDRETYIINGNNVVSICLLETTQEKYNHQ